MYIYLFIYIQREHTVLYLFFIKQYICHEKIFSASGYQYIFHISAHRAALFCVCVRTCVCSVVSDSANPWTEALQAPLSMEFPRQEYWSGLPFPAPGDHSNPGIESSSLLYWQADSLLRHHLGSALSFLFLFSCSVMSTLCDPMGCRASGFPVLYHLPEFAQTPVASSR